MCYAKHGTSGATKKERIDKVKAWQGSWGESDNIMIIVIFLLEVLLLSYIIFCIIYYVFKELTRSRPGKGAGGSLAIS